MMKLNLKWLNDITEITVTIGDGKKANYPE